MIAHNHLPEQMGVSNLLSIEPATKSAFIMTTAQAYKKSLCFSIDFFNVVFDGTSVPNGTCIHVCVLCIPHGKHCFLNLHAHLVFVTKCQSNIFTQVILDELQIIFLNVRDDLGTQLIEFNSEHDQVHLLVHYPPKITLSTWVNSLKGVSSGLIQKNKHPSIQKNFGVPFGHHVIFPQAIIY